MRYFLMVLGIGAALGAGAAGLVAVAVWPDIEQARWGVVERVVEVERTYADIETPVIDNLLTDEDWAEIDRQSDCLFDWLQEQVGYEITLERVLAAGYWTDALGGACYVMGVDEWAQE
jgi:hypothetical protein